jgi:hypothetical protein
VAEIRARNLLNQHALFTTLITVQTHSLMCIQQVTSNHIVLCYGSRLQLLDFKGSKVCYPSILQLTEIVTFFLITMSSTNVIYWKSSTEFGIVLL